MAEEERFDWNKLAARWPRQDVAEDAVGDEVIPGWQEHDTDCTFWIGDGCNCPSVFWFRGVGHMVSVGRSYVAEVHALH